MNMNGKIKAYEMVEDGSYSHVEVVYVFPETVTADPLVFKTFPEAKKELREKINFRIDDWMAARNSAVKLNQTDVDLEWDEYAKNKAGIKENDFY